MAKEDRRSLNIIITKPNLKTAVFMFVRIVGLNAKNMFNLGEAVQPVVWLHRIKWEFLKNYFERKLIALKKEENRNDLYS